ncbi:SDR family NAD(P)-dependent oxidoreductase [Crossiella cryophila]|uniref:3-oxoacyl-[acyl-carrier protein] reductase n=1 Tax=Crossiella cryophila TaxID=43355 RepID=A0A7W7CB95_9PSEU|nr:SDR family NAD(P)-dependent oxidoreductase [Crossiella cryophila]MBB4677982.1 3-oxoacyl-[acyl-carrier protein] reductase [Crossiella cryophila]
MTLPDLSGTAVLITGAAGGLGHGLARRFAEAGAAVAVHYRASVGAAHALVAELRELGTEALALPADLLSPEQVGHLVESTVDHFGRLDTLVNNAAVQPVQPLPEMTFEQWREVLGTNLDAVFLTTSLAVKHMEPGSSVINIASIEGSQPAFGHAHYSTAKAGLLMQTRAAALEYGPLGVRVNAVSPGLLHRDGLAEQWPEGVARWEQAAPLTRLGQAEDVGNACVFLASRLASWISGQNLVVDGGMSAHPNW